MSNSFVCSTTFPVGAMTAEMPVRAAWATHIRCSAARSWLSATIWALAAVRRYEALFVDTTIIRAPLDTNAPTSSG